LVYDQEVGLFDCAARKLSATPAHSVLVESPGQPAGSTSGYRLSFTAAHALGESPTFSRAQTDDRLHDPAGRDFGRLAQKPRDAALALTSRLHDAAADRRLPHTGWTGEQHQASLSGRTPRHQGDLARLDPGACGITRPA